MSDRAGGKDRIDWKAERERIDLAALVTVRLGPAPGRTGEHGRASGGIARSTRTATPRSVSSPGSRSGVATGAARAATPQL